VLELGDRRKLDKDHCKFNANVECEKGGDKLDMETTGIPHGAPAPRATTAMGSVAQADENIAQRVIALPTVIDHAGNTILDEDTTRERVLQLIVSDGPVNAAKLADILGLTPAGVRRHISYLEDSGQIQVYTDKPEKGVRGRPSRQYVATNRAHVEMPSAYSGIAAEALAFIAEKAGSEAVEEFAAHRFASFEEKYASGITATDPHERAEQLAKALNAEGFAASIRPVSGVPMLQLCQGHCPVQDVAAQFPQLCEAEAKLFSKILGTHTQRLVTLAGGGHVCTTNVPVNRPHGQ
jgi:predicted ArsR family transcriptional regulator